MGMEYWMCLIGPVERNDIPMCGDSPLRMGVRVALANMMGDEVERRTTCSSGWGVDEQKAKQIRDAWHSPSKVTSMDVGEPKTAEEMGMAMMTVPMGMIPLFAMEFAKKLCNEMCMCSEVLLTAWTVYAQCVHGLPCADDLYKARPQDWEWFNENAHRFCK